MFNPPYQLTLCELTASPYSDMNLYGELKDYLTNVLHRTVAESKDLPAFLGNRIGFYVMNEALQYAEKYQDNGGIDYIDSLLGPFTGRTMPPITTADLWVWMCTKPLWTISTRTPTTTFTRSLCCPHTCRN